MKATLSAGVATLTLALTWFVGHRFSAKWALRQKRKELELSTTSRFYELYGEFLTVWRLWKVISEEVIPPTEEITRAKLLERATVAEGGIEAILAKISSERTLEADEIQTLGLYRQAYQQLRQSIRDKTLMLWGPNTSRYLLFQELSAHVACLLADYPNTRSPSREEAARNIHAITAIRSRHWNERVASHTETWRVASRSTSGVHPRGIAAVISDTPRMEA